MLVYRKANARRSGAALRRDVTACCARGVSLGSREALLSLVVQSGELESALEDLEHPSAAAARALSEAAADALVNGAVRGELAALAERIDYPSELELRRAEGYAYYALDPLDYAELAEQLNLRAPRVSVLGIRSIGSSLSAIVASKLRALGSSVERASVRPTGHPWDRRVQFGNHAQRVVENGRGAPFLIVDEGPGLSGSSFLAVGDALVANGVPSGSVYFLCSRRPDASRLLAPAAEQRWSRFRATCTQPQPQREGELDLCAGQWRALTREQREAWPVAWRERERSKYLDAKRGVLRRFIGYPPYGEPPFERAEALASAGFSPGVLGHSRGFMEQHWETGRYFPIGDLKPVERIATYVAFRARTFPAQAPTQDLEDMLRTNVMEAIGREPAAGERLPIVTPMFCDGSMGPHEWLLSNDGRILKTDASDHGDDHFYPGPCDSAWDLAGAAIEWQLAADEREHLLNVYWRLTGDDASARLPAYELAYASFRVGCMRMAQINADPNDGALLACEEQRYLAHLRNRLQRTRRAHSHGRDLPA